MTLAIDNASKPTIEVLPATGLDQRPVLTGHYSALTAHRTCPQRWMYRYHYRLTMPDSAPTPERNFGSWWGAITAANSLERGRALDSLKAEPRPFRAVDDGPKFDPRTVTAREVLEAANVWWRAQSPEVRAVWVEKLGEGLPHRLLGLYRRWRDEFAAEMLNERPLGVEVFWERELFAGDETTPAIRLIGFIDEVLYDAEREQVIVRDRKAHKQLEAATSLSDMMDSQLQLYAWGAEPLIESWGLGKVRAVSYDRARSVKPKQPQIAKTTGALSKAVTAFDLATYREWAATDTRPVALIQDWLARVASGELNPLMEHVEYVRNLPPGQFWAALDDDPISFVKSGRNKEKPRFGVYQEDPEVVRRLELPSERAVWFDRTRVPVNNRVINTHLIAAFDTAAAAWQTKQRAEQTGQAARNLGKACEWCDYDMLCRAQMWGGADGEYELAEYGLRSPDGMTMLTEGRLIPVASYTDKES